MVQSFPILGGGVKPIEYHAVDLGLPSGLKWCDRNIGAISPEDGGLYFQWGDTQGYTIDQVGTGEGQKVFSEDWSDYKFNPSGDGTTFTKYNSTDGKTVLEPEDDAVRANMGGDWRMPTYEELMELFNNTDLELEFKSGIKASGTTDNGSLYWDLSSVDLSKEELNEEGLYVIKGMRFINRSDSSKFIFVPAAGFAHGGSVKYVGDKGNLWPSSLYDNYSAWNMTFNSSYVTGGNNLRFYGFPVRAVLAQ